MSKPLDDLWVWLKAHVGDKAVLLVALAVLVAVVGEARISERLTPLAQEQARLRLAHERYEKDVREFREDVRELYRVTPWVRPSARLEAPLPPLDGGE